MIAPQFHPDEVRGKCEPRGKMSFGLLGDFDAIDDLPVLREGLDRALAELVEAARTITAERDLSRQLDPAPVE